MAALLMTRGIQKSYGKRRWSRTKDKTPQPLLETRQQGIDEIDPYGSDRQPTSESFSWASFRSPQFVPRLPTISLSATESLRGKVMMNRTFRTAMSVLCPLVWLVALATLPNAAAKAEGILHGNIIRTQIYSPS